MKPLPLPGPLARPAARTRADSGDQDRDQGGLVDRGRTNAGTLWELYRTLVEGGRWWLVPLLGVLALTALLLAALAAVEYVAPFVYTVF